MNKVKEWNKVRAKLKKLFASKGIVRCELCGGTFALSFHHRHKRIFYYSQPELLGDFNQVVLVCCKCHDKLEVDKNLTKQAFERLRK